MKMILTSKGINTERGAELIKKGLEKLGFKDLCDKKVLIIEQERNRNMLWYISSIQEQLINMGFVKENISIFDNKWDMLKEFVRPLYDIIYIGEGSVFDISLQMQAVPGIHNAIAWSMEKGGTYIGASAGAMMAGRDCKLARHFKEKLPTTMDGKVYCPPALGLLDGAVIPHYKTKKEYTRFINSLSKEERSRYKSFYFVPEDEALVLENQPTLMDRLREKGMI